MHVITGLCRIEDASDCNAGNSMPVISINQHQIIRARAIMLKGKFAASEQYQGCHRPGR